MTEPQPLLGLLGLGTLAAVALLLAALFALLRDGRWQRSYFSAWAEAWVALLVVALALLAADLVVPRDLAGVPARGAWTAVAAGLRLTAEGGRLLHAALLLAGVLAFTRGFPYARWWAAGGGASFAWGGLMSVVATRPDTALVWQSPVMIAASAAGAALLLSLPASRQGIGSRVTAAAFLATAVLWTLTPWAITADPATHPALSVLRAAHPSAEVPFVMALGFGMVILRMEDTAREAEDARAELAVANDRLRRLAMYDPLTDCLNRRAFIEGIGLEVAKSTFGTVAMLDLDDFKAINDDHGHAAGDELLAHLAGILRASTRPRDRLYRWGGDEFLLVMPEATPAGVAARLARAVAAAPPVPLGPSATPVRPQVSVGAEAYTGGDQLAWAIDAADAAMYRAKRLRKVTPVRGAPIVPPRHP